MHNNITNQKILLIGIVIMISLSLFIDPFLNDILAKSKKKTSSKTSSDQDKSSNLNTNCKVGLQTNNSCNNNNINIILGDKDKLIYAQGQLIVEKNNTGPEINNTINPDTNKNLPMKSIEPIKPTAINYLPPPSSLSTHCEEVPGPNMTFINSCSNK